MRSSAHRRAGLLASWSSTLGPPARVLLAGVPVMALPLLVVHLVTPAAMGFGDVKLAVALGAGLGVLEPKLAVLALAVASGLTLLAAACTRRSAMPFAPGLVIGAGRGAGTWSIRRMERPRMTTELLTRPASAPPH